SRCSCPPPSAWRSPRVIALDQGGVPLQRLGQRPGGHQLGDIVHPVEVRPTLDLAPGLAQQFVGDPPAQEVVAGHQVLVRILLGFLSEVPGTPAALAGLAETTRVLDNIIKRDQGRHAELPHLTSSHAPGQPPWAGTAPPRPAARRRRDWPGRTRAGCQSRSSLLGVEDFWTGRTTGSFAAIWPPVTTALKAEPRRRGP